MLAKLKCHRNLGRSVDYNEVKLTQGKAECILAVGFIKDAASLSQEDKLARFNHRTSLHERSACNAVHISLNFSKEDVISNEKMRMMAQYYMSAIGFDRQPYVVYRHYDTNHPHAHVVSTNITAKGKRIQLQEIVQHQSRKVAAEIEEKF